jgi:chromosome segregation ATPase
MAHREVPHEPTADAFPRVSPATRVDGAHVRPREAASAAEASPAAEFANLAAAPLNTEATALATIRQVRAQATQLAAHLQRKQATVDHREAELNARLAAMEKEIRGARLWLNERHAELAQQKTELDRRQHEMTADGQSDSQTLSADVAATQQPQLEARVAELDRRQAELDAMAQRLAEQLADSGRVQDFQRAASALENRRENLDRIEKLLASEQSEVERGRSLLEEERAGFIQFVQVERQRLTEEEQHAAADQDKMRRELKRRSDELTARHRALERMRSDIAKAQSEGLEMRLATEELWSRLCGTMAPAALTQSLAQIRVQLADEQRLARRELAEQKAEVQSLSARLAEQHDKLAREREELQSWAVERQNELAKQAALLVAGNERIEQERAEFKDQQAKWTSERFQLQAELRRLLGQLNRTEKRAA